MQLSTRSKNHRFIAAELGHLRGAVHVRVVRVPAGTPRATGNPAPDLGLWVLGSHSRLMHCLPEKTRKIPENNGRLIF